MRSVKIVCATLLLFACSPAFSQFSSEYRQAAQAYLNAAAKCQNPAGAACMRQNAQYYNCLANQLQGGSACGSQPSCSTACTGGGSSGGPGGALLGAAVPSSGNAKADAVGKLVGLGVQLWMSRDTDNPKEPAAPDPSIAAAQASAAAAAAQQNANAQAAKTIQEANTLMASLNGSSGAPDSTATLSALLGGGATSAANGNATSTIVGLLGQGDDGGAAPDLSQALQNAQQSVNIENYGSIPAPPAEIDFPKTSADAAQMYTPGVQDDTSGWAGEQNPALTAMYKDAPPIQEVTYHPDGTIDVKNYPQTFQSEITFPSPGSSPVGAPSPSPSITPSVAPPVPPAMTQAAPTSSIPAPIGNTAYATPTAASAPRGQPAEEASEPPTDGGGWLSGLQQRASDIKQQLTSPFRNAWNEAMEAKRSVSQTLCNLDNSCGDSK